MSETKDQVDKTGARAKAAPLSMKRTESAGLVKQSFSHGRVKSVVVEKKKPRKLASGPATSTPEPEAAVAPIAKVAPRTARPNEQASPSTARRGSAEPTSRVLSANERDARIRALNQARELERVREIEDRRRAEEEAKA